MKLSSIVLGGIAILALVGCDKKDTGTPPAKQDSPSAASAQIPAAVAPAPLPLPPAPPPPVLVDLNKDTVLDAFKRSSVNTLPIFLKISDATFDVVNSVDTFRVIKGDVTLEFLEDTFVPSRELTFSTSSTNFKVELLKTVKKKGDKVTFPFEARLDLMQKPLNLVLPPLENYGREMAQYRHYYPEGGDVAVKAEAMMDAAADASRKAQLVEAKWNALNYLKNSLVDADHFQSFFDERYHAGAGGACIARGFDDEEFGNNYSKSVLDGKFNSLADRYAAHKNFIQARFDKAYSPIEKIINDAKDKVSACSDYLLGL